MMGLRRTFTKDFKLSVLQELETKSPAQVAREHNIHPNIFVRWKREFNQSPKDAFAGRGKLWKDEAKLAYYERLVGQLYAEIVLLKKSIGHLQQLRAEERKRR